MSSYNPLKHVRLLALLLLTAVLPAEAVTVSDPVAAEDNLAPEPVSNVTALLVAGGVEINWDLSVSDVQRSTPTGDVTSGGTFVAVNDVSEYRIYRSEASGDFVLAGTVGTGESQYIDDAAVSGAVIVYRVTAADASDNESDGIDSAPVSLGPPPTLVLSSRAAADLGAVAVDSSASYVLTISNEATEANANLSVTASFQAVATGVAFAGFSADPVTILLEPGASGDMTITFDATAAGNINGLHQALLVLQSNDPDTADREVVIGLEATVSGGVDVPEISVSPLTLNFSNTKLATTATRDVVVSNLGGLVLTGSVSISGSSAFTTTSSSFSLDPGASETVQVAFTPADLGDVSATLTISSNDSDEAEVEVALSGTGVAELSGPGTRISRVAKATLRVTNTTDTTDPVAVETFIAELRAILAQVLGISPGRIKILSLTEGSTIVQFQITSRTTNTTEPTASEALAALNTAVADNTSDEFTDLGGTESFLDESADVVVQPVDEDGGAIVGWFTFGASGTQVGFDDFFLFADNFGTTDGDGVFDSIYDIAPADEPNGAVDFDDFFRFADDFGKPVANAQDIIDTLD